MNSTKLFLVLGGFAFGVLAASMLRPIPGIKQIADAAQDAGAAVAGTRG